MLRNRMSMVFVAAAALTLILSACGSPTPTATVAPTAVPPTNTAPAVATSVATTPPATAVVTSEVATSAAATSTATSAAGGPTLPATGVSTTVGTPSAAMTFPLCAPSASLPATGVATTNAVSTLSVTADATVASTSQSALVSRIEALRIGVVAVDACGVSIVELPAGGIASNPQLLVADVIVAVDGKALSGDPVAAFTAALAVHKANDQVMLTVQRMGQEIAVTVTMGGGSTSTSGTSGTMAPTMAATSAAAAGHLAAPAQATATPVMQETPPATKPATLRECAASGVLKVGSDASYPPFESVNEKSGKVEGFDVDLITAIGQKEGFQVDVRNALFDTIFTALSYGQYDLVLSAATITDERKQTVNFSNPYFVAGQVIVVRKADTDKIKTPADLAGKNVGVQLGTTGAEAAKGIKNVKSVKEYPTAPEAFQALANGDLDAVVNDNVTSLSIILNSPKLNLVVTGSPFTSEFYGIAVRKDCTALLDKVNKGLAEVIADGTYAKIYAQYLGEEPGTDYQKGGKGIIPTPAGAATAPAAVSTMAATAAK